MRKEIVSRESIPNTETESIISYFRLISKIPRPSGSETSIRSFLIELAERDGYRHQVDDGGNVLIQIPSTSKDRARGVILQGHMDMVSDGNPSPSENGTRPEFDQNHEWIFSKGTTLGADNGIGMASALLIAEDDFFHGPLALLFTVQEETGMDGARKLNFPGLSNYSYLINLDSEDEGSATVGSAGGQVYNINLDADFEMPKDGVAFIELKIIDLKSGHSGVDIHLNRANAILIFAELVKRIAKNYEVRISSLEGGVASNVIPGRIKSSLAVPNDEMDDLKKTITFEFKNLISKFDEPNASISIEEIKPAKGVMTEKTQKNILDLITELPNGALSWDSEISGLVHTSNNLGKIELKNSKVKLSSSSRSFSMSDIERIRKSVDETVSKFGGTSTYDQPYSGWKQSNSSHIVSTAVKVYKQIFDANLKVEAVHAGLECGLISAKYPQLEIISIGATIKNAHTVNEKVEVSSIGKFYKYLKALISEIN